MLVTDVKSLFFNTAIAATAARLKDIQGRLADEIWAVERDRCQHAGSAPLNTVAPNPQRISHFVPISKQPQLLRRNPHVDSTGMGAVFSISEDTVTLASATT